MNEKQLSIEDQIRIAKEEVAEAKKKYDLALDRLNRLLLFKNDKNTPVSSKDTDELNAELSNIHDDAGLKNYLKENRDILYKTYSDWLKNIMETKNISAPDLYNAAAISRGYFHDVKNGHKNPSKETVIKIGLALQLTLDELNRCLKLAGWKELYSKNRNDAIIIDGIKRRKSVHEIDQNLKDLGGEMILTVRE